MTDTNIVCSLYRTEYHTIHTVWIFHLRQRHSRRTIVRLQRKLNLQIGRAATYDAAVLCRVSIGLELVWLCVLSLFRPKLLLRMFVS